MKISVLIPVFNAASTLLEALESIMLQTVSDIEICAVDDCSSDSSTAILEAFKLRYEVQSGRTMKILRHTENRGVAAARNTALDAATGDYICWLDADDRFAPDALALASALANGADVVGWDWTLCSSMGNRYMRQPDCATPEEAMKALMGGTLRWNLWLFMISRAMFEDIRFTPGMNMGEDMMAVIRIMMKAKAFVQIHQSLYSYLQTSNSISKTMSSHNLSQSCANLDLVAECLTKSRYGYLIDPYLDLLKLNVKLPLLVSEHKNDYIRWLNCYPEASRSIMKNHHLPLRTKLLQWMASKRMWTAVLLYNKLIYGCVYGFLVKM